MVEHLTFPIDQICVGGPAVPIAMLHAAEFLLQQRDPERLRIWLEKHSMQERAEILRHLKERRRAPGK